MMIIFKTCKRLSKKINDMQSAKKTTHRYQYYWFNILITAVIKLLLYQTLLHFMHRYHFPHKSTE